MEGLWCCVTRRGVAEVSDVSCLKRNETMLGNGIGEADALGLAFLPPCVRAGKIVSANERVTEDRELHCGLGTNSAEVVVRLGIPYTKLGLRHWCFELFGKDCEKRGWIGSE